MAHAFDDKFAQSLHSTDQSPRALSTLSLQAEREFPLFAVPSSVRSQGPRVVTAAPAGVAAIVPGVCIFL